MTQPHAMPPAYRGVVVMVTTHRLDVCVCDRTSQDPGCGGGEEPWDCSATELERRCRLGSEVNSLSLSRSSNAEKGDALEHLNFKLSSNVR